MKRTGKKGFTIVELLTVMGVIAVLIGLLVPALALVKDYSKRIQQRAQFHGIDVGLEIFKTETGAYPESKNNVINTASSPQKLADPTPYCGANKLAEAMVGLDMIGYHPNSDFRADGENTVIDRSTPPAAIDVYVYDTSNTYPSWQTASENIQARKGPFMDLENANVFDMEEVYTTPPVGFIQNATNGRYPLVLCDVYAKKRSGLGAKKTGTPILYFRARPSYVTQDITDPLTWEDDIYYYDDNRQLVQLGKPDDGVAYTIETSPSANAYENFENMIINDQVQSVRRPYRSDTYILVSAGKDGDFGTADDIFNFEKEVTE